MSLIRVPEELPKMEKKLIKAESQVASIRNYIVLAKRLIQVRCTGFFRGGSLLTAMEGCGKYFQIVDLTWLQKYHYVNEPYNEHHEPCGGAYRCPDCHIVTHITEGSDFVNLRAYFGKQEEFKK